MGGMNPHKKKDEYRHLTVKVAIVPSEHGNLNQRQLWFLGLLQKGKSLRAQDIATAWRVSLGSARSDLAQLTKARFIKFVGARKNGQYKLK
jgi:Fic family protein